MLRHGREFMFYYLLLFIYVLLSLQLNAQTPL